MTTPKFKIGEIVTHKIKLVKTPNVKMTISYYLKRNKESWVFTNKETDFVYCKYFNEGSKSFVQVVFNINEIQKIK